MIRAWRRMRHDNADLAARWPDGIPGAGRGLAPFLVGWLASSKLGELVYGNIIWRRQAVMASVFGEEGCSWDWRGRRAEWPVIVRDARHAIPFTSVTECENSFSCKT